MKTIILSAARLNVLLAIGMTLAMTGFSTAPATANDGRRLLEGLLGTGAKILIEREMQKRERRQPPDAARMSRNQTRRAQAALNDLGYNAGTPDGVAGSGTRAAIRRYQAAIGAPPTGYLTRGQLSALLNSGGAIASSPSPETTDHAGQAEEELNRDQVLALQKGLNALGYNAGKPDGKAGRRTGRAISAFLRDRGYDPYTTQPHDALEMVVRESGVKAPAALSATAAADTDSEVSIFDDQDRSTAESGTESAALPLDSPPETANWSEYKPKLIDASFDLQLELARRAIHAQPAILDDDAIVKHWFEEVYPSRLGNKSDGPELARRYYQGTPFEKKDVLSEYRELIRASATDAPLKFTRSFPASLDTDEFDRNLGIPMYVRQATVIRTQKSALERDRLYIDHIRRNAEMLFDDFPDISHLPITEEAEARRISKLLKDNRYANLRLETYLTVKRVGVAVLEDSYSNRDLLTDASMDGVALILYPNRNTAISKPQILYRWALGANKANPELAGMPVADFAGWAGIRMINGHLAVNQNDSYSDYSNGGWRRFFDLGQLADNPSLLDDDDAALFLGNAILTEREKSFISRGRQLFGGGRSEPNGRTGRNAFDEFEFPEVMDAFRDAHSAKILAHRPAYPVPVVHITAVALGDYDHDRAGFPLLYGNADLRAGLSRLNGATLDRAEGRWQAERVETGIRTLPGMLDLPADRARKLINILAGRKNVNNKRAVYLAVFSETGKPERSKIRTGNRKGREALLFEMKPRRIALFADSRLRQLIREFEINDGWAPEALNVDLAASTLLPDIEMVALWKAANVPGFLDDPDTLRAHLGIRGRIEDEFQRYRSPIGPVLPESLVSGLENPLPDDLEKFAGFLANAAQSASFETLHYPYGVNGSLNSNGGLTMRLDEALGYGEWINNPLFDEGDRNIAAEQKVAALFPNAAGFRQIRTAGQGAAYLAFRPNPAWFAATVETGLSGRSSLSYSSDLYLKVHEARYIEDTGNGDAVVFEVEPLRIVVRMESGDEFEVEIPPAKVDDDAPYPTSDMDILGAKIGMTLDEAIAAVKQAGFVGDQRRRVSSQNYALGNGLVLFRDAEGEIPHIAFFTKSYGNDERVIGISRYVPDHGADPEAIVNAFTGKYGQPDGIYKPQTSAYYHAWGDTEATKKLIQVEGMDYGCIPSASNNMRRFDGVTTYVDIQYLAKTCGVVLSTYADDDMYTLLVDTNAAVAEHKRLMDERRRKQEEAEAKQKAADIKL